MSVTSNFGCHLKREKIPNNIKLASIDWGQSSVDRKTYLFSSAIWSVRLADCQLKTKTSISQSIRQRIERHCIDDENCIFIYLSQWHFECDKSRFIYSLAGANVIIPAETFNRIHFDVQAKNMILLTHLVESPCWNVISEEKLFAFNCLPNKSFIHFCDSSDSYTLLSTNKWLSHVCVWMRMQYWIH